MVPVRIVDVSDAEADAMTLADNARAIQGHDDAAMIVEMASAFERDAAIMADIGLGSAALDALIKQAGDAILDDVEAATDQVGALRFRVVVDVRDEDQQAELMKRLESEGYKCQPLMS
jgi:hypothetical protein